MRPDPIPPNVARPDQVTHRVLARLSGQTATMADARALSFALYRRWWAIWYSPLEGLTARGIQSIRDCLCRRLPNARPPSTFGTHLRQSSPRRARRDQHPNTFKGHGLTFSFTPGS